MKIKYTIYTLLVIVQENKNKLFVFSVSHKKDEMFFKIQNKPTRHFRVCLVFIEHYMIKWIISKSSLGNRSISIKIISICCRNFLNIKYKIRNECSSNKIIFSEMKIVHKEKNKIEKDLLDTLYLIKSDKFRSIFI